MSGKLDLGLIKRAPLFKMYDLFCRRSLVVRMLRASGLPCPRYVVTGVRYEIIVLSRMLVSAMLVCKLLDPLIFYDCEEQPCHQIITR